MDKSYSKHRVFINATREDLDTLRDIIGIRFSRAAVLKTSNNSTQNKCEASNRSVKRSTPSQLTFSYNYHARVHTAVHSMNNNPGTSVRLLCSAVGAPITESSSAYKETQRMDAESEYNKQRKKSHEYKVERKKARTKRYKIYAEKKNPQPGYSKDGALGELYIPLTRQKSHLKDHAYQSNRITVLKKKNTQ